MPQGSCYEPRSLVCLWSRGKRFWVINKVVPKRLEIQTSQQLCGDKFRVRKFNESSSSSVCFV